MGALAAPTDICAGDRLARARAAAAANVFAELRRSRVLFPAPLHSLYEAASVLEEELDELKDAVRANLIEHACVEAVQVAAMALRLTIDLAGTPACAARDRLAVEAVLISSTRCMPADPLVSAHEGCGYLRCWHHRLCAALAAGQRQQVFVAANAVAGCALRFVAEIPLGGLGAACSGWS
ncbi:hypothetical protein C0J29_32170 (plasmid) [Mycobacterium paragordonae]|uniref:Uncharacterized protein n=1 Tax=Mycobacterium paragordonae TaxID=1389713 RepID=A0ABQ1CFC3_9MYCO|nr:hypothetical protein [Mycobacterium paragordonae]AYE99615.1 hypothetical protein C0J29_32170 [Mycobacterium paragordonae]GFG83156.1 hypothetical protein MPRG_64320 [Mycobacterium paragordonae]